MHQNRWRLGLRPRPNWGSLQRSPRPPNWIQGVLLLRGREGMGREGKGEAGEGSVCLVLKLPLATPLCICVWNRRSIPSTRLRQRRVSLHVSNPLSTGCYTQLCALARYWPRSTPLSVGCISLLLRVTSGVRV